MTYFQNCVDLLVLAETTLDESHPSSEFYMDDYRKPFRRDKTRYSGGLLIYVNEDIPSRELNHHTCPNDIQHIVIELNLRKQKWLVIGIYHPPNQSSSCFLDCLSDIIDQYNNKYDRVLCIGDFNITPIANDMKGFFSDHELINLIKEPTCFKSTTNPSCIDLIITNQKHSFKHSQALETGISDFHKLIHTVMKTTFNKSGPKRLSYRCFRNFNVILFRSELSEGIKTRVKNYTDFSKLIKTLLDKHAPSKIRIIRANEVPYMTKTLRKAIMTRSRLKNTYHKIPTSSNWKIYKNQRNLCVTLNRKTKQAFFSNLDCKNPQTLKNFWEYSRPYFTDKVKSSSKIILLEGDKIVSKNDELVKCFNEHFNNIYESAQPFNTESADPVSDAISTFESHPSIIKIKSDLIRSNDLFDFKKTSFEEIVTEISKLKSNCAVGFDGFPAKILKLCSVECAPFFVDCFNSSMETSTFPLDLKCENLIPVPKSGDLLSKINCRQISVLTVVSKVF